MVARRPAGYAVAMEVARRAEGPEVNGDLRKTVSRRSLVPSRELERKGYRGLALDVIGHVIHRKPPSLGASGSSFVRDLVEYTLCFELLQEFWKGQDR